MFPSEAEIKFAKYGHSFQASVSQLVYFCMNALIKHGNLFKQCGQDMDQMGSKRHLGHTLRGQVKVDYIHFLNPDTNEEEILQVTMGHDESWNPVISVSSSLTNHVAIPASGDPIQDFAAVKDEVFKCFAKAGINLEA